MAEPAGLPDGRAVCAVSHYSLSYLAGMYSHIHTQNKHEHTLIGIDPGRAKCGIAAVHANGILKVKAVRREVLIHELHEFLQHFNPQAVAVGNLTGYESVVGEVKAKYPQLKVMDVDERNSTREGIALCISNSANGLKWLAWLRLFLGFEKPDGWAAAVIAKRALADISHK